MRSFLYLEGDMEIQESVIKRETMESGKWGIASLLIYGRTPRSWVLTSYLNTP